MKAKATGTDSAIRKMTMPIRRVMAQYHSMAQSVSRFSCFSK